MGGRLLQASLQSPDLPLASSQALGPCRGSCLALQERRGLLRSLSEPRWEPRQWQWRCIQVRFEGGTRAMHKARASQRRRSDLGFPGDRQKVKELSDRGQGGAATGAASPAVGARGARTWCSRSHEATKPGRERTSRRGEELCRVLPIVKQTESLRISRPSGKQCFQ